jgi:ankyrin repeat protein
MPELREWRSAEEVLELMADFPEFGRLDASTIFIGVNAPAINEKGIFGNTPLKIAAVWGDPRAIELLVAAGARINDRNEDGYTALHHAASQGHLDAVKKLLALGADPLATDDEGQTAVQRATDGEIIEYLSKARA